MFCPQCGQQQAANDIRFCSRCGLQLAAVTELLAGGAAGPGGAVLLEPAPESPRRRGAKQGGKFMLFGIFLIPLLAIIAELTRPLIAEEIPLLGVMVFLGGLLRLIYALCFEDGPFRRQYVPARTLPAQPAHSFGPHAGAAGLPPAQTVAAREYAPPRHDTSEIAYHRPSVTEHTTRLLDDQHDTSAS